MQYEYGASQGFRSVGTTIVTSGEFRTLMLPEATGSWKATVGNWVPALLASTVINAVVRSFGKAYPLGAPTSSQKYVPKGSCETSHIPVASLLHCPTFRSSAAC
jgi:hypothetical protein